ncbi:MAG TPA: metallophosphoesterase [Ignavibacteria bacterium]|nr:metallophosphoesterase [Ignavibacteria bacterium]HQY52892.1 metallophosphoesterase [Ignavibacteria bacterium]HRB00903.1 metallophosphoesterase [Ignavibacteria bacterium]
MSKNTVAVIGDVHGCYYTLKKIHDKLKNAGEVYTVGDLIDRGKYSKAVVEYCISNSIKSVRGNHEDMMLKAIEKSDKFLGFMFKEAEHYYYNGGKETQNSYIDSKAFSDFKKFKQKLKDLGHYDFIQSFPLKYEFKKVVISHAGIIPGGDDVSILWNRRTPEKLDKLQIFGHTPLREYVYKKEYYSNIDTGCVFNNKLTAVIVDINEGIIVDVLDENCDENDVDPEAEMEL